MSGSRGSAGSITLVDMLSQFSSGLTDETKKQLKQMATKENKQKYLAEYSQNPWCVPGNTEQYRAAEATAFDYFLRAQD